MDPSGARANVLPAIEAAFSFLIERFGFDLAQTTEIPSGAWYRANGRTVVVAYDFIREARVEVRLEQNGSVEACALQELLAHWDPQARPLEGVRDFNVVTLELQRAAGLLDQRCAEFLRGDFPAFARRHREALLVQRCRALAHEEFYRGDPRRAANLFGCLRQYWTDSDREHFERARSGEGLHVLRHRR